MELHPVSRDTGSSNRRAVSVLAGVVVAGLVLGGVGPAHPPMQVSHSLPSSTTVHDEVNLTAQPGITVGSDSDLDIAQATARARAAVPDGDPACIAFPLIPGTFRITSTYGMRTNPITGGRGLHAGVDLAAPMGSPIHAVADGVVSYAGPGKAGRSSELVIVDHDVDGNKFSSWYVHMYPHGVFVSAGQKVRAGEEIAQVGSNGFSTGPHLHLEIHSRTASTGPTGQSMGLLIPTAPSPSPSSGDQETEEPPLKEERPSKEESADSDQDTPGEEDESSPEAEDDPRDGEDTDSPDTSEDEASEDDLSGEDEESTLVGEEQTGEEADWEFEVEEVDDRGENDHVISDVVRQGSGVFDPSSFGVLHDPLPFLRDLGYGLVPPASCYS